MASYYMITTIILEKEKQWRLSGCQGLGSKDGE